jgi:hypothetical protein
MSMKKNVLFLSCDVVRFLFWDSLDLSVSPGCSCACCVWSVLPISMVARAWLRQRFDFSRFSFGRLGSPCERTARILGFLVGFRLGARSRAGQFPLGER